MVTRAEVINWARGMADRGVGHDQDGAYGAQCVDLTSGASAKFFGKPLWGNGNEMLDAARSAGYTIEKSGLPRPGAFFSANTSGHGYGHTGLVISEPDNTGAFQTIEQNVDGSIDYGGPARYRTRRLNENGMHIFGWFYPPYSDSPGAPGRGAANEGEKERLMAIHFMFNIVNDPSWNPGTVFYYNGAINEIQGIHSTEEHKYLASTFKETTGRDLKSYTWDAKTAPVYVRLFNTLKPGSQIQGMQAKLDEIRRKIQEGL